MKALLCSFFFVILSGFCFGQLVQFPSTDVIHVPPIGNEAIGIKSIKPRGWTKIRPEYPNPSFQKATSGPSRTMDEGVTSSSKTSAAYQVAKLKGFVANNMDLYTPGDNSMGISSRGYIVSADNYTIDYYSDAPDTLMQFQRHHEFYNDSTIIGEPFDPHVIYDHYANRFIVVTCIYSDSTPNYLLISFSKDEDPRLGWNHYRVRSDTMDENQWFDFPSIGINRNELFITGNMLWDSTNVDISGNKVFQIRKKEGYQNNPLAMRIWNDVLDGEGDMAYTVAPISHGLQSDAYNRGIYMVSTKNLAGAQSSNKLFWYEITDSLDGANPQLIAHTTDALVPYSSPVAGLQLGNMDFIKLSNTKAHGGFYMDSVLNFVYCRNFNNYSVIVLNRLDIRTNTIQRFPLGFTAGQIDYSFPSLAFMGADSTDPDNMILGYLRTGAGIFPEIAAIHFDDGAFWPTSTIVKQGEGPIDYYLGNQIERFGDYTTIQRRYDADPARCWLVGCYSNGANSNHWGATNLLNAYIAELGDSAIAQGSSPSFASDAFGISVYPVPNSGTFTVRSTKPEYRISHLSVSTLDGRMLFDQEATNGYLQEVSLEEISSGIYFVTVVLNEKLVHHEKIVVTTSR